MTAGRRTPAPFLTWLVAADLAWNRVAVTLTDERWVAPTDPASNAASVQATLLTGRAAAARFVLLYTGDPTPGAGSVLVLFTGKAKRRVFETARGAGPVEAMPIRALLRNPTTPVEVFCT